MFGTGHSLRGRFAAAVSRLCSTGRLRPKDEDHAGEESNSEIAVDQRQGQERRERRSEEHEPLRRVALAEVDAFALGPASGANADHLTRSPSLCL
jgi:hypothetical protein